MILIMKALTKKTPLTKLVTRFLGEMHRFAAGRTLPLLHAQKLTTAQLAALEFVFELRTISAVASYLGPSRPATSQMIQKLVRRGVIRRSEGTTDRREKTVVLSARGRVLLEKVAAARAARFAESISCLPSRAAGRLKGALREAVRQMEKGRAGPRKRRSHIKGKPR
jgi:MarR family transcriptional regulator, organic hydroperoxide resistance regulator